MDFLLNSNDRWAYFWDQVALVMPEIWLVIGMCAVIIVPFFKKGSVKAPAIVALGSIALALVALGRTSATSATIFHGTMAIDTFSQGFKFVLLVFTALVIAQWMIIRSPDGNSPGHPDGQINRFDSPDFLCLLLGAAFGMSMMASANSLLMVFVATEAASMPSFALAGFRKKTRLGTEASLKYVLFGAASSAVMLYGMSLVYGACGSLNIGEVAAAAAGTYEVVGEGKEAALTLASGGLTPLMAIGLLGMFGGFAFKLSAVPLHFWCPDVFQGAPIQVTTFLSVASKGAAIAMMVRVLGSFGEAAAMLPAAVPAKETMFAGLTAGVAVLGGLTAFWGNLVAYHQTNIKRLLAYSSIAHAGYMIMAASVMAMTARTISGTDGGTMTIGADASDVASAILFYIIIYLFMNLAAFTIAALVTQKTGTEDINGLRDLKRRSPLLAIFMTLSLLSLFGMPGLGGFIAKVYLATSIVETGWGGIVIVAVLLVNTLISFFYYMRPIITMLLHKQETEGPAFSPKVSATGLVGVCAIVMVLTGFAPGVVTTGPLSLARAPLPVPSNGSKDKDGDKTRAAAAAAVKGNRSDIKTDDIKDIKIDEGRTAGIKARDIKTDEGRTADVKTGDAKLDNVAPKPAGDGSDGKVSALN